MVLEPSITSGSLAVGTTTVSAKPAIMTALVLNPGSAASSVTVYDNATAGSGTVLATLLGVTSGASVVLPLQYGLYAANGITVVVAGTAATATVAYKREA